MRTRSGAARRDSSRKAVVPSQVSAGEMAEWLKAHAWKACLLERVTWVRIPLSPPASLNCREIPPPFTPKYAKHARNSRLFAHKPDCRERTARQQRGALSRLFSGGHMRSPVSRGALGECNAITSRRSGHGGLTFVSTLKTGFGAFDEPVWRPRHEHSKEVFHHTSTAAVLVNPPRIAPWRPRKDWPS